MEVFSVLKLLAPMVLPSETKIHLASYNGHDNPLNVYLNGEFDEWQRVQTRRNFERRFVLSLISLDEPNSWLFGGLHHSGEPAPYKEKYWHYPLSEIENSRDLNGRLIVQFHRPGRQSYLVGERWTNSLLVKEILRERMQFARFPGFKSVLINTSDLRKIIKDQLPDWKAALSSVAGVYLIADNTSGKLYVGSATGEGGLWGRWCCYADTGHGNNVELRAALRELGSLHADNFQFSILEIADTHTSTTEILRRESHWKSALLTRHHGYNRN